MFETHLDAESEVSYGFHLSSPWERWQLLNFYKHLFTLPGFDPRAMGVAKEIGHRDSLEKYLDTLIPNVRKQLFDRQRAEYIGFPNLGGKLAAETVGGERIFHFHITCNCKVHDVLGPPGICWLRPHEILEEETFCSSP